MMATKKEMFEALHPDPTKQGTRVTKQYYDAYKAALLEAIPADEDGIFYGELPDVVEPLLDADTAANTKTMWWVTCVKLDLEARGLIERVPGKGKQRVKRI